MTTPHDYMADWTPEERAAAQGMPPNVAVGFIASRRGTDVRGVHQGYRQVADQLKDLINRGREGGQVGERDLREAFETFSSSMPPRAKEEHDDPES